MKDSDVNLLARAIRAHDRVERTLRGARPRDLSKRFRHLLRPAEVVKKRVDHPDGTVTVTHVPTTLSYLGLAGHLRVAAWQLLEADLREKLHRSGTVTGRHRVANVTEAPV